MKKIAIICLAVICATNLPAAAQGIAVTNDTLVARPVTTRVTVANDTLVTQPITTQVTVANDTLATQPITTQPPATLAVTAQPVGTQQTATQDKSKPKSSKGGFFDSFGLATKISTLGLGVDFITTLHSNIKLRMGCSYLGFFSLKSNKNFTGTSTDDLEQDVPVHIDKIKFDVLNGNLLFDLFPWKSFGFHLTVGLYIGKIHFPVNGSAPQSFKLEDYVIKPDASGNFKATLRMGNIVKPYIGIGFGRTIPKSRLGYKLDLGIMYQGHFDITSDNMDGKYLTGETTRILDEAGIPEIFRVCWPMISFSAIYRIK